MKTAFSFETTAKDKKTKARTGIIHTPHGDIETPAFVPVGTQGTVKSLTPEELNALGVRLFFVNTYHMYLRPGLSVIRKFGGLHRFMGWNGPIITDSGGFQVFSLGRKKFVTKEDHGSGGAALVSIGEDGVVFRSHWDGSKHTFTPELSMQYQWTLGSDIHVAFDDCTAYPVTPEHAKTSMERTHRWAARSLKEHQALARSHGPKDKNYPYQALFGAIQGSVYKDLREQSARFITGLPFDGFAIGGVAVGESKHEMKDVLSWVTPFLPEEKPRHLLGVGEIDDIFELVSHGIDTFDCVQATRLGRMGRVFVRSNGKRMDERVFDIDITKQEYIHDEKPIDEHCGCYTCQHFSKSYLRHLFHVRELLAYRLATIHNMYFVHSLMTDIRSAIQEGTFTDFKTHFLHQ